MVGQLLALVLLLAVFAAGLLVGYLMHWRHWRDPEVAGAILQRLYACAQKKWIWSDDKTREHCPVCGWNKERGEYARVAEAREAEEERRRRWAR